MDWAIAEMSIEDYDDVIAFWRQQKGVGLSGADEREGIAAYLKRNPGMSFVVRDEGTLVGAVLCGHDGRRGYLHHLAVDPAYRRQGIGKTLVHRCLRTLAAAGIQKCNIFLYAHNPAGQAFWRAVGWDGRADLVLMQSLTGVPEGAAQAPGSCAS